MNSAAVEFEGISKSFCPSERVKGVRALDGLTLRVHTNEVYGLLGPNGAGKSTALKIILGLVRPDAGVCRIHGLDSHLIEARTRVGYLPESPWFPKHLTGMELVVFYGRLCGMSGREVRAKANAMLELVGLNDAMDRRVGTYSKGMLQRLGLAQALIHDPRLLILDEPTAGVDPCGVEHISRLILRLKADGKTVVLCSHLLSQMEQVCDRVGIMHQGRIMLEGPVTELVSEEGCHDLLTVRPLEAECREELASWLAERNSGLVAIEAPRRSLHSVYLERIRREEVESSER